MPTRELEQESPESGQERPEKPYAVVEIGNTKITTSRRTVHMAAATAIGLAMTALHMLHVPWSL